MMDLVEFKTTNSSILKNTEENIDMSEQNWEPQQRGEDCKKETNETS